MRKILILTLCLLFLSACGGDPVPTAAPSAMPIALPTYTHYPTYTPWPTQTPATLLPRSGWQQAQVLAVDDGDTIEVALDGRTCRVRYIGIDTPELGAPCYLEATRFNSFLVTAQGKTVYLEKDTSEVDRYGRLLRYVWIIAADHYTMVNAELVAMGYAVAKAYPPDTKYQPVLMQMEQQARQAGLTLCRPTPTATVTATPTGTATSRPRTSTATTSPPTLTPALSGGCPQGCTTPPPGCLIKGNISSGTGEKIYHVPGQRYYEQTRIDPNNGERWFCTEEEAIANGWRKSKQ